MAARTPPSQQLTFPRERRLIWVRLEGLSVALRSGTVAVQTGSAAATAQLTVGIVFSLALVMSFRGLVLASWKLWQSRN